MLLAVPRLEATIRIGIVGVDSSHAPKMARIFNDANDPEHVPGARIACFFKGGSADLEMSRSRIDRFATEMRDKFGIPSVPTIAEVIENSDAIMLLSVDGRVHLDQAREVIRAGKPLFIDKPLGGSLQDALAIVQLARQAHTPVFSSSSLRFAPEIQNARAPQLGPIRGAISFGPAPIEPTVPDLYFYGIHPVEALYAIMGSGCESVSRSYTEDTDVVTGVWKDGRNGVLCGLRNGKTSYGLIVFGRNLIQYETPSPPYAALARKILSFFQTKIPPVSLDETLEIMAFMEAADESKRRGGARVALSDVMRIAGGQPGPK